MNTYSPKKWDLANLHGISDETLQIHFGLYEGYVKNTNTIGERLAEMRQSGKNSGADPAFAEVQRRLSWEYDGMRLHEYYFDNLTKSATQPSSGKLYDGLGAAFGGFDAWKKDFAACGAMRGIGWVIAYQDPTNGQIINDWVGDHNVGNLAGSNPIVVMDVWEHAWFRDYKPAEKGQYVESFLANVNWSACEARLR
ncbi:MAG: superoxide dismutase [Candidatus Eremiobacteraeota bacterium]|nr:superoxide dismutase [Candidatus Eremiobacteraeota bacterium]